MRSKINRIIDANLNRAREGLRVVEELARMVLEDGALQKKIKEMRHQITLAEKSLNHLKILKNRAAGEDPGAKVTTRTESKRKQLSDLGRANLRRCQEALRVLEEFTKFEETVASRKFKALRFTAYDLEVALIKRIEIFEAKGK